MLKKFHNQGLTKVNNRWIISRTSEKEGFCELLKIDPETMLVNRCKLIKTEHCGGIDSCDNIVVVPTFKGLEFYEIEPAREFKRRSRHYMREKVYAAGITELQKDIYLVASIINDLGTKVLFSTWNKRSKEILHGARFGSAHGYPNNICLKTEGGKVYMYGLRYYRDRGTCDKLRVDISDFMVKGFQIQDTWHFRYYHKSKVVRGLSKLVPEKLRGILVLKKPSIRWSATVIGNEVFGTRRNKLEVNKLFTIGD